MKQKLITYKHQQHHLPEQEISPAAVAIIKQLNDAGYDAYIVGGAIRDLLLGLHPKDFDISTNATPEDIKNIFKHKCRIIGRRFRLAHIYFNGCIYEVATFRGISESGERVLRQGQIIRDNSFGTIEQDSVRRDFTCNALYYDISKKHILDFVGGFKDIKAGVLKLIGDPNTRYLEDPVRMLRSIRFHSKLGLDLPEKLQQSILKNRKTLANVPAARLFDEVVKIFHCGSIKHAFKHMIQLKIFAQLFPNSTAIILENDQARQFLSNAFRNTDHRLKNGQSVTPVFLMSCVLWLEFLDSYKLLVANGKQPHDALHETTNQIMTTQRKIVAIPKAIQTGIRQIWMMQLRFKRMYGKSVYTTLHHPRFRAAYDFLLLRAEIHPHLQKKAQFWTNIQELSPEGIKSLIFGKQIKKKKITSELV